MLFDIVKERLKNEEGCLNYIEKLRVTNVGDCLKKISFSNSDTALAKAAEITRYILRVLTDNGFNFLDTMDPCHGVGHFVRSYINTRLLLSLDPLVEPADVFLTYISAVLHDVGRCFVPPVGENRLAVPHSWAGAIVIDELFKLDACHLSAEARQLVSFAIGGHQWSVKPRVVLSEGGATRVIESFPVEDPHGKLYKFFWLVRCVDRLDGNGSTIIGRDFLHAYNEIGRADFAEYLSVFLEPHPREKNLRVPGSETLIEGLYRLATTQNNSSPYSRHDFGNMIHICQVQTWRLLLVLNAVQHPEIATPSSVKRTMSRQTRDWLTRSIDPSKNGQVAARVMLDHLDAMPDRVRLAWLSGFNQARWLYSEWSIEARHCLDQIPLDDLYLRLRRGTEYCVLDILA